MCLSATRVQVLIAAERLRAVSHLFDRCRSSRHQQLALRKARQRPSTAAATSITNGLVGASVRVNHARQKACRVKRSGCAGLRADTHRTLCDTASAPPWSPFLRTSCTPLRRRTGVDATLCCRWSWMRETWEFWAVCVHLPSRPKLQHSCLCPTTNGTSVECTLSSQRLSPMWLLGLRVLVREVMELMTNDWRARVLCLQAFSQGCSLQDHASRQSGLTQ